MSSHHIVKDQQEPALLILDAQDFQFDQISSLLEWVPTVLVAENALDRVLSWGIKVDVILASPNFQKQNLQLLEEQYPVKFLSVQTNNYLEEGLQFLIASKHTAVNILGFDHREAFSLTEKLESLNIVLFDGPMRYFPARSGELKKWFPKGSLQLHAPEKSLIEMKIDKESQWIEVQYATFVEVNNEGLVTFKSLKPFWIGEMQIEEKFNELQLNIMWKSYPLKKSKYGI
ncbi:thiamine pyrophosphokinase [Echinicola jeungdonensis]|uniref:Thiamine pyrophosphokinase n=1 Tax=Echinicola jeungdonensis TaxID=709343 RepID=A0ABV5J6Y8_9BACT|nr:thiamine pyrophosphokinase [Echinicola jeungdonensis]MDN3669308.1 thiamine pyrophosphokinase [Echinicola jeungdonensis]